MLRQSESVPQYLLLENNSLMARLALLPFGFLVLLIPPVGQDEHGHPLVAIEPKTVTRNEH